MFTSAKNSMDALTEAALSGKKFVIYGLDHELIFACADQGVFNNLTYLDDYVIISDYPTHHYRVVVQRQYSFGPILPFERLKEYTFHSAVVLEKVNQNNILSRIFDCVCVPHDNIYCQILRRYQTETAPQSSHSDPAVLPTIEEETLHLISDLDKRPDFPPDKITKKIAILSTPSCGSSMFCNILRKTGKLGHPYEWFSDLFMRHYKEYFGIKEETPLDLRWFLDFVMRKTTSSNGIFSVNFHILQYSQVLEGGFDIFALDFDKIYYLYRKEKIDQAYSHTKAAITGQWFPTHRGYSEPKGSITKEAVMILLTNLIRYTEYYEKTLQSRVDREFYYEDFSCLSSTTAYHDILADLGITEYQPFWTSSVQEPGNEKDAEAILELKKYLVPSATFC